MPPLAHSKWNFHLSCILWFPAYFESKSRNCNIAGPSAMGLLQFWHHFRVLFESWMVIAMQSCVSVMWTSWFILFWMTPISMHDFPHPRLPQVQIGRCRYTTYPSKMCDDGNQQKIRCFYHINNSAQLSQCFNGNRIQLTSRETSRNKWIVLYSY